MNLLKGIVGITKAITGVGAASEEQQSSRYRICIECPKDNRGMCGECGCVIAAKIRNASEACPIGKWLPETLPSSAPRTMVGTVPLEQFKHRLSLCHGCERMTAEGTCGGGSLVATLASYANVGCPLRRWETLPTVDLPAEAVAELNMLIEQAGHR